MGKLSMLLLGAKPPMMEGKGEEGGEEDYGSAGKKLAAKEILKAISEKDEELLVEALSAFVDCC